MIKLISWNVNARVKDGLKQVQALSQHEPHIVALQDVREKAVLQYEQAFAKIGLRYILHTFQNTSNEATPTGVLVASCFELERLPPLPSSALWLEGLRSPHPEIMMKHWARRTLFVTIQSPWGGIDLYNAYITPGSNTEKLPNGKKQRSLIKLDLLSGVYHALAVPTDRFRILCGDFNTPQEEKSAGEILPGETTTTKRRESISEPDLIKIWLSVVYFKGSQLTIFLMPIASFTDMKTGR